MGFRTNAVVIAPAFEGPSVELLRCFGVDARPVGRERLADAWHPAHLSVGRLGGCSVVLDHLLVDLALHGEDELDRQMATTFADRRVLALHLDEDSLSYGWVLWDRGARRRAVAGSARDGLRIVEGTWLPEERRWPVLIDPVRPGRDAGLRWIDPTGRARGLSRMGPRWVRWIAEGLLGAPIDGHPDVGSAWVERFVERSADDVRADAPSARVEDREPLPVWLRRILGR